MAGWPPDRSLKTSKVTWPTCTVQDGKPCTGVRAAKDLCLYHLDIATRRKYLEDIHRRSSVDCRGTRFDHALISDLRDIFDVEPAGSPRSLTIGGANFKNSVFEDDADLGWIRIGNAVFDDAVFEGRALFGGAQFLQNATFRGAQFKGDATFDRALFNLGASFAKAVFDGDGSFVESRFMGHAWFDRTSFTGAAFSKATFQGDLSFPDAIFLLDASFSGATFEGWVSCSGAVVGAELSFNTCKFSTTPHIGPIYAGSTTFSAAEFEKSVTIEIESRELNIHLARFMDGVALRAAGALVIFDQVYLGAPSSVSSVRGETRRKALTRLMALSSNTVAALGMKKLLSVTPSLPENARVGTFRGTDVSNLVLADIDLTSCRFSGSHNLDKLKFEGDFTFGEPPRGWNLQWGWPPLCRWTARRVIAEEFLWRQTMGKRSKGWFGATLLRGSEINPKRLEGLYRTLRKAFEDGKNEAGSGDFYYGEMEARRASARPIERFILFLYWLTSGYGQRAGRAVAALSILIATTTLGLAGWGIPEVSIPAQVVISIDPKVQSHQVIDDVRRANDQILALPARPWTLDRLEKGARISLGSVVFRDAGQPLTRTGVWMLNLGRFLGPVLIALAVLAIRARVKR